MMIINFLLFRIKRHLNRRRGRNTYTREHPAYNGYVIGEYTYGFPAIRKFSKNAELRIGKYCSIAQGVKILLGGEHNTGCISTYPFESSESTSYKKHKNHVVIGHDVWIGENVLILSGVTIGHGAVIAAGSVVTKDIPPYSICVGVPCKPIKYRFDGEVISKLIEVAWWDWPHSEVEEMVPILSGEDIRKFFEYCARRNVSKV